VKGKRLYSLGMVALISLLALVLGSSTLTWAVQSRTQDTSDLSLSKVAPALVLPGGEITYQLTITNSGAQPAQDVVVKDVLPPNTSYVSGGTLVGDTVEWTIPSLAGYGGEETKTLVLTADAGAGTTILNDTYSARAYSGQAATGTLTATTRIVDSYVRVTPQEWYSLTYSGPDAWTVITLPVGLVTEPTTLAYEELDQATHPLAVRDARVSRRSFRLSAFRFNRRVPSFRPTVRFSVTLSARVAGAAGAVRGADEETLQLYRWDQGQWSSQGITCLNEPVDDRVSCGVAPQELGEFTLMEAQSKVYLPLVLGGYEPY
jgi:uncharacterized repeat protein (TIGR01451 family)